MIFVTGANGCIGNVLVTYLAKAGYETIALAMNEWDRDRIEDLPHVKIVQGDICKYQRMAEIFATEKIEVVIHLAALVHRRNALREDFLRVNLDATKNLFDLAVCHRVRQFIFLSTVAVLGETTPRPLTEENEAAAATDYALSKYMAEQYIRNQAAGDTNWTILRATTVYGKYDLGNIKSLFRLAQRHLMIIIGDGTNMKSFVYVDNLVNGILRAILNTSAFREIIILADGRAYSINEIVATMRRVIGKNVFVIRIPIQLAISSAHMLDKLFRRIQGKDLGALLFIRKLTVNNVYDIAKSRAVLHYEPRESFEEGIRKAYL